MVDIVTALDYVDGVISESELYSYWMEIDLLGEIAASELNKILDLRGSARFDGHASIKLLVGGRVVLKYDPRKVFRKALERRYVYIVEKIVNTLFPDYEQEPLGDVFRARVMRKRRDILTMFNKEVQKILFKDIAFMLLVTNDKTANEIGKKIWKKIKEL